MLTPSVGVASGKVEQGWKTFQRRCLKHIAESLCSIRDLVNALGQDALDVYCRDGRLSAQHVQRLKQVVGYFATDSENEDVVSAAG